MFQFTLLSVLPLLPSALLAQSSSSTPRVMQSSNQVCMNAIADQAQSQACLQASSTPTLGLLFPISPSLFVSNLDGSVGMGTTAPAARLHVIEPSTATGLVGVRIDNASLDGIGLEVDVSDGDMIDPPTGVNVLCANPRGVAIRGSIGPVINTGSQAAVIGAASGPGADNIGVFGAALEPTGDAVGVFGASAGTGDFADAVRGIQLSGSGRGAGVYGLSSSNTDSANGVLGEVGYYGAGPSSSGVRGRNYGTTGSGIGVWGSQDGSGYGVFGTTPAGRGVYGRTDTGDGGVVGETTGATLGVLSIGDSGTTGTKFFIQPHPEDAKQEIRFVSLEGNESGTYFRGSARTTNGSARILVPEEFRLVSELESLTVQVTARGPGNLWVETCDLNEVIVRGTVDVNFDYFVNGIRRGFADVKTVRENTHFIPRERGVPFGTQYPDGLRRILVESGILNADYTPNEATARRLGWELAEPSNEQPARRRSPLADLLALQLER